MRNFIKFIIPYNTRVLLWKHYILTTNYYKYIIARAAKTKNVFFDFNGKKHNYFNALYNNTYQNERAVEIPIILDYVFSNKNKNILEVGNVMNHYLKFDHEVVDKYEKGPGVLNCDIVDFNTNKKYDLIFSISTFEHIGFDEVIRYSDEKTNKVSQESLLLAFDKTKSLLNVNGIFVFTVPIGFNSFLDSQFENNKLQLTKLFYLKKTSKNNTWTQVAYNDIKEIQYGQPYACANGLVIGIFKNEIL